MCKGLGEPELAGIQPTQWTLDILVLLLDAYSSTRLYLKRLWFVEIVMKIKVTIDEKDVALNPYVELVFAKVVDALVSTLRDVAGWKKVRLEVEK